VSSLISQYLNKFIGPLCLITRAAELITIICETTQLAITSQLNSSKIPSRTDTLSASEHIVVCYKIVLTDTPSVAHVTSTSVLQQIYRAIVIGISCYTRQRLDGLIRSSIRQG